MSTVLQTIVEKKHYRFIDGEGVTWQEAIRLSAEPLVADGSVDADYYKQIKDCMNMELCGWVDKNYRKYQAEKLDILPIEHIQKTEYDYILVAVRKQTIFREIKKELTDMGISEEAVIWGRPYGAPYEDS